MSKYAERMSLRQMETEEAADPMALPPGRNSGRTGKESYLNEVAAELYKKEQEVAKAKAKAGTGGQANRKPGQT